MTYWGKSFGVRMFASQQMQWFDDIEEARRVERIELAKFAQVDAEAERVRLARLGLKEVARTYSISLADPKPARRQRRGVR